MRNPWRLLASLAPCAALAAVLLGCSGTAAETLPATFDPSGPAQARVVVTTGFGANTLLDAVVGIDARTSAMKALESIAETETGYGGGFVQSINGVGSTRKSDWFYYVNGLMAKTGAKDYVLRNGDVEHWDYHSWSSFRGMSAVMGCFPWAFVNGYGGERRPSIVACEPEYGDEADGIAAVLRGAGAVDVSLVPLAELTPEQMASRHLVLVAGPDAAPVREVFDNRATLGLFVSLDGHGLRAFSPSGEEKAVYQQAAGVLAATQNPWNPRGTGACENVVVVVSGCDEAGVRAAARTLVHEHERLLTWCGAVVEADGRVRPLPAAED